MSPFLETPQVSLSQRPCLEWAEALSMQTVGDLANKLVKNGEAPQPHTDGQKLQIGLKIAGTMIQGWLDAHIDRVTEEPSPRGDLLDSFRRFMYQYVGHPEREQRYNHENPVPIRDHRPGARQVFSHAVASFVDWGTETVVVVAKDPWVDDISAQGWAAYRYVLSTGHIDQEEISQIEKGAHDITLYTFPRTNGDRSYSLPQYYSLSLNPDYRAETLVVSHRTKQPGRGNVVVDAVLGDDVGTLFAIIKEGLDRQGLAPELLQHDIHPLAQHDTNVRRIFAAAAA